MIKPSDLELMELVDQPQEVVEIIFNYYAGRNFTPSQEEQQLKAEL